MDGLLLDTEDLYTLCANKILAKYDRPNLPWPIKAQLQGRPGPSAAAIFYEWAQLPIPQEQFAAEQRVLQEELFHKAEALPGAEKLLRDLESTKGKENRVHIALATSSHEANFKLKTTNHMELFTVFADHRRVLGDDTRIEKGRGKPLPDIYLLALKTINSSLDEGEKEILPEECLVFEDSVPGVEAGRRAGMRVIWVPHPELGKVYKGQEKEVLAGLTGSGGSVDEHQLGKINDGWAEQLATLENFPYERYGIKI